MVRREKRQALSLTGRNGCEDLSLLDTIESREDLLRLTPEQDRQLCAEIREFLVKSVAQTGGHLASNLGVVELTLAIEKVFDTSRDRLVFDVGHQSYVHKLLTGRKALFPTLRQFGGLAGFPKPSESDCDAFIAGHASNAVSVALGMARARTLRREDYSVVALMGDGALTGGLAYEGLNNAGASREPLVVILNDNGMSIRPNVGSISRHLKLIRTKPGYFGVKLAYRRFTAAAPGGKYLYRFTHWLKNELKKHLVGITLFEEMGFSYIGPVDGTDVRRMTELLRIARELNGPVLVHVITKKGMGYPPAEQNPDRFHGVGRFDPETGMVYGSNTASFSASFGGALTELAAKDQRICAVTAAMQSGTGLDEFARLYPRRLFDVGIAESHAVSMAAGLAKQGMIPVVAVYSTFLQRAFDQLLHDVALLRLHVVFAVDRAGLVGEDGETHHGVFDVAYLRAVPGMQILCPANLAELKDMLRKAVLEMDGPVAVRYPRGGDGIFKSVCVQPVLRVGRDVTLVGYGTEVNILLRAAAQLAMRGVDAEVVKLNSIKPLDVDTVAESALKTGVVYMLEETVDAGCVASALFAALAERGVTARLLRRNLGDSFVPHGTTAELLKSRGLDAESVAREILEVLRREE